MPMYQLQLPERLTVEGWLDEVSWLVLYELLHHPQLQHVPPHAFARVRELLRAVLEAHVTTYRGCGVWSFCRAGATPSAWGPETAPQPTPATVRCYILEVKERLEEVVTEATDGLAEFLFHLLGESLPRGVLEPAIEIALRRGIGKYLYDAPNCGTHPLCQYRVEVNPWRDTTERVPQGRRCYYD